MDEQGSGGHCPHQEGQPCTECDPRHGFRVSAFVRCERCGGDEDHGQECVCYALEEEAEQRRALGYCGTCGGDGERGYACVHAGVYTPDRCPEITGRF